MGLTVLQSPQIKGLILIETKGLIYFRGYQKMSQNIDKVFQLAYDAEVKRAYGQVGLLQPAVYTKTGVIGKSIYFRKKGKGLATQHIRGNDRTVMNTDFTQVECALSDWDAFDFVDKLDMKKINFSEIQELAEIAGDCLGLRKDQIIINALESGYDSTNMKVGTTNTNLSVATLRAACKLLNKKGVPNSERYFIHDAQQLEDLLSTTEITSSDYNSVKALVQGEIGSFLGLKFILVDGRDEGGLPTANAGADRVGFVFHKRAVGFALGQDVETEMEYDVTKGGWLVGGSFSAGAVVIDTDGVVGVISDID